MSLVIYIENREESHAQGKRLSQFTTTNPDHLFEIHPVTEVGGQNVSRTLKPIVGFKPKEAENAFFIEPCEVD